MILSKKNFNINPVLITNLVFAFFPISFIFGNLFTNINLILFCCLGLFHLRSKILTNKFNLSIKIIFVFFFIIFFSTSLSFFRSLYLEEYKYYDLIKLIKSILFFRFFLMLVIVYLLSKLDILNFKYFFLSAAFISLLVSLDIIYQYIFGFNVIGLKSLVHHNSGFFGDELIAGNFIKNFSFFSIFFVVLTLKNKKNLIFILTIFVTCILGVATIFSGNKMALISFLFGIFLIFLFSNRIKKILSASLLFLFIICGIVFSFDSQIKNSYSSYYKNVYTILLNYHVLQAKKDESKAEYQEKKDEIDNTQSVAIDEIRNAWEKFKHLPIWKGESLKDDFEFFWVLQNERDSHVKLYLTAIDVWSKHKIFGNGIKSFREDCKKLVTHKKDRLCSNHPHNYYIEILVDAGILGIFILMIMAILFTLFIIKNFKFLNVNNLENSILFAAIISLIVELFPIQSTGSLFTTNNATYLVLLASIIASHKRQLSG